MKSVENCIRTFKDYALGSILAPPRHARRAKAVAFSLEHHLSRGDLYTCYLVLAHQQQLLNPEQSYDVGASITDLYPTECIPDVLNEIDIRHRSVDSYHILAFRHYVSLKKAFRHMIQESQGNELEPGTAITHRIWFGKLLRNETLQKILACNRKLKQIWRHPVTGHTVPVRHLLWTDNPGLLAESIPGIETCHVRDLTTARNAVFHAFLQGFILKKEYAFAADIVRYLALHRFGGLHLGMHWGPMETGPNICRFTPTRETLKIFADLHRTGESAFYRSVFRVSSQGNRRTIRHAPFLRRMFYNLDSEVLYIGHPDSDVMTATLENLQLVLRNLHRFGEHDVIRNHREAKKEILEKECPEKWARNKLHRDPYSNIGAMVTNKFSLEMALDQEKRFTIMESDDWRTKVPYFSLPENNLFRVVYQKGTPKFDMELRALGLVRAVSQSWLRVSRDYRPSFEL